MKSLKNLGSQLASTPVLADDILEFHAARLLLLLKLCGVSGRVDGLTKLAKLDFFVRYPQFFEEMATHLQAKLPKGTKGRPRVESSMVRFHYGPWDERYYHVLSYLEAKSLITVVSEKNMYRFALTDTGRSCANQIEERAAYAPLVTHMKNVKRVLGAKAGSTLKNLIYEVFDDEVAARHLGERIT